MISKVQFHIFEELDTVLINTRAKCAHEQLAFRTILEDPRDRLPRSNERIFSLRKLSRPVQRSVWSKDFAQRKSIVKRWNFCRSFRTKINTNLWSSNEKVLFVRIDENSLFDVFPFSLILASIHSDDLETARKIVRNLQVNLPSDGAAAATSRVLDEFFSKVFRNLNEKNAQSIDFIGDFIGFLSKLDIFVNNSSIGEIEKFLSKFEWKIFSSESDRRVSLSDFRRILSFSARRPFIQSSVLNLRKRRENFFSFSGSCKDLPGIVLEAGDLTDQEFKVLENYLLESAYSKNEVYNVRKTESTRFLRERLAAFELSRKSSGSHRILFSSFQQITTLSNFLPSKPQIIIQRFSFFLTPMNFVFCSRFKVNLDRLPLRKPENLTHFSRERFKIDSNIFTNSSAELCSD